jgi:hypothetical protein
MDSVFLQDFQKLNGTTWFYLSSLLLIAVYFRFSRFFSLRNWDLLTLILLAPGLLMTNRVDKYLLREANLPRAQVEVDLHRFEELHLGYVWLFVATGYLFVRCLVDLLLARRPHVEPNLNVAGLAFLAVALLVFLVYEVITKEPDPSGRVSARTAARLLAGVKPSKEERPENPVTPVITLPLAAGIQSVAHRLNDENPLQIRDLETGVARSLTILCNLALVAALVLIGWQHFGSPATGMGIATLYLALPSTAVNIAKIDHLLPSAFLVWAVYAYKKPWVSGALLGAAGVFFYPLFLVPLWTGFYWRRGAGRFVLSGAIVTATLGLAVWWLDPVRSFMEVWTAVVSPRQWSLQTQTEMLGFWTQVTQVYRLPIFIGFLVLTGVVAFWPTEKNLAELIALSVAIILGTQFWYADRGGTYIHWYLPLLLLMVFRPNLSGVRPPPL